MSAQLSSCKILFDKHPPIEYIGMALTLDSAGSYSQTPNISKNSIIGVDNKADLRYIG
jgi:hypothetical protein